MSPVAAIARNTARGTASPKAIAAFVLILAFMVVTYFMGAKVTFDAAVVAGEEDPASVFGDTAVRLFGTVNQVTTLVAFFLGLYAFPTEIRRRTIVAVLARPVTRLELAVGKVVGLLVVAWGMVLAATMGMLLALLIVDVPPLTQFYLGIAHALTDLAFTICFAVALGMHVRPVVGVVIAIAIAVVPEFRNQDNAFLHYAGEVVHWLSAADAPRNLINNGFTEEVLDLAWGLHLAVIGENLLYAAALVAASAYLLGRRDIRLGEG